MELLFVYGTWRDPVVQKKIFGKEIPSRAAKLDGYCLKVDEDGFFNLIQGENNINGRILELNNEELFRADQWEEVPVYERELMEIESAGQTLKAWVYLKKRMLTETAGHLDKLSASEDEVLNQLLNGFCRIRDLKFAKCDVILRYSAQKMMLGTITKFKNRLLGKTVELKAGVEGYVFLGEIQVMFRNYPLRYDIYWLSKDSISGEVLVMMGAALVHPEKVEEKLRIVLAEFLRKKEIELTKGFRGYLYSETELSKRKHYRIMVFPEWFKETYSNRFLKEVALMKIEAELENGA